MENVFRLEELQKVLVEEAQNIQKAIARLVPAAADVKAPSIAPTKIQPPQESAVDEKKDTKKSSAPIPKAAAVEPEKKEVADAAVDEKKEPEKSSAPIPKAAAVAPEKKEVADDAKVLFFDTPIELIHLNRVFMSAESFQQLRQPAAITIGNDTFLVSVNKGVPSMGIYRPAHLKDFDECKFTPLSHAEYAKIKELSNIVFLVRFAESASVSRPSFCEKTAMAMLLGQVLSPLQDVTPKMISMMQKSVMIIEQCTALVPGAGRIGPHTKISFQQLVPL